MYKYGLPASGRKDHGTRKPHDLVGHVAHRGDDSGFQQQLLHLPAVPEIGPATAAFKEAVSCPYPAADRIQISELSAVSQQADPEVVIFKTGAGKHLIVSHLGHMGLFHQNSHVVHGVAQLRVGINFRFSGGDAAVAADMLRKLLM